MRCAVECKVTRTLVLLSGVQSSLDDCFCINIIVAEVSASVGTLKLSLLSSNINILVDAVHIVILPDRSDVIFLDLVRINIISAVTDEHSCSKSLIESVSHQLPLICNNIEICDVQNIISVESILDVDCLSVVSSAQQLDLLHVSLLRSLSVTLCRELSLSCISSSCSYTSNGRLMYAVDYRAYPSIVVIEDLGFLRIEQLILREQCVECVIVKCCVREISAVSECRNSLLQRSYARCLSHSDDVHLIRVRDISRIVVVVGIEYIVLHSGFLLVIFILVFECHTNHSVYDSLLFLSESVEYFLYGLFVVCVICFVSHLGCILLFSIV